MLRRVYTAVLRDQMILMVRLCHEDKDFWTLPGGGIEAGETLSEAAAREVLEETGVRVDAPRELYREGDEVCFLATCSPDQVAVVGSDPELSKECQIIRDVRWFSIEEKRDDLQVSRVLAELALGA